MTDTDKWIESTYKELEDKIKEQEDEFVSMFIDDYLSELDVNDSAIDDSLSNYTKISRINDLFDEAYEAFILSFLLWYGSKLIEAGELSYEYFISKGLIKNAKGAKSIGKFVGLVDGKIKKDSFLYNLGMMGEIRQSFQNAVMNAVASKQKLNVAIRNMKPIFKSNRNTQSDLAKYYLKYAFNPIMQVLNTTSYKLAVMFGMTHFDYVGGLIEKSRDFCIERDGNTYTIAEGKSWNSLNWRGKIKGVDFFAQTGGYLCRHHLEFHKNEDK